VYARAKVVPDLALSRGQEAHRAAKLLGDQATEFAAAGGVALEELELGDIAEAERWLGFAAQVASNAPTQYRTRQLESWRGRVRAGAGDADGMRRHLEQAVTLASRAGPPARAEASARLALEAARLGARTHDDALLTVAAEAAEQAKLLAAGLPGHSPWAAQADAARAEVALTRGDVDTAVAAGVAVAQALQESFSEDVSLDMLLPASRAIFAGAPDEVQAFVREHLRLVLSRIAQATVDDAIRVRWLKGPFGRELVELAGGLETVAAAAKDVPGATTPAGDELAGLDDVDRRIVHLLTEGQTNREMAEALGMSEADLGQQLARVLARLGASSRAEATSLAFRGLTPPPSFAAATGSS